MEMARIGYGATIVCLIVGLSRFGHNPLLHNPQPQTAKWWLIAAVVLGIGATIHYFSNTQSSSSAQ